MILTELYILNVAFILVLTYSAKRIDPEDKPLALSHGYILFMDLSIKGTTSLWRQFGHDLLLRSGMAWIIDVMFVSTFASNWVIAHRYRSGQWPAHLVRYALILAIGLLAVMVIHVVQREYMGLGPWDVGVRWVALNGASTIFSIIAAWHMARVLCEERVLLAHLVLFIAIVIALVQLLMALQPGAWDMEKHRLANLVYMVASLVAYGARIIRHGLGPGKKWRQNGQ